MTYDVMRLIGNIGIIAALIPYLGFVILYAVLANWRKTEYGVHLMSFMASITLILLIIAIRNFFITGSVPFWYEVVRLVTFVLLIPPMAYWRLALLIREQREVRRQIRRRENESSGRVRNEG